MFNGIKSIVRLTFLELKSSFIILGLFIISTLVWVMLAFAVNLDVVDGSLTAARIFGDNVGTPSQGNSEGGSDLLDISKIVVSIHQFLGGAVYWVGILLALFATAPLITSIQQKGSIDLLLSKPISRNQILSGRLAGVFLAMLILLSYLIFAVWLVISVKTGVWKFNLLLAIPTILLMFAVMYSVITLISVLVPSTALALIVTYGLIFASIILSFKSVLATQINLPWRHLYNGLYHVLPNFAEVTQTVAQLAGNEPVENIYPIISSVAFGLVVYALAFYRFNKTDY